MRVVLDTNVLVSGIFFTGPPNKILRAWHKKRISLILSTDILDEYHRVGRILSKKYSKVDITPVLQLITTKTKLIHAPQFTEQICEDPDDDKFLECAIATNTKLIISGDKKLLAVSGYSGIEVISPRKFIDMYL